jgi:hypothetical protein
MTRPARRRLRAPTTDGEALIDPPLSEAAKLIEHNQKVLSQFDGLNRFGPEARRTARKLFVDGASYFTRRTQTTAEYIADEPHVLCGHQPELFHPGVWLKNFVVSSVAQVVQGRALNLVIDSDTNRTPAIKVPDTEHDPPIVVDVPFDRVERELPWQSRTILNDATFAHFPHAVNRLYRSSPKLLDQLWPHCLAVQREQSIWLQEFQRELGTPTGATSNIFSPEFVQANLGECLALGRNRLERDVKLHTSEFPLKLLGHVDYSFSFIDLLLRRHRELHAAYNSALQEFRLTNHVRSPLQPIPDLIRDGDWYEMPLWRMHVQPPVRRRVFVRQVANGVQISDRSGDLFSLSDEGTRTSEELATERIIRGVELRPRALITTMYARLVLSDLFIHGIGGAKYDEVTDEIIRRFFGIEPPKYITATATFRLPIERPHVTIEDIRDVRQKLRDVRYRPESFLRDSLTRGVRGLREQLQALADEKREYVRTHDLRRCEEQVYARLDKMNRAMYDLLKPVEQELRGQDAQLESDLRRAELLGSREFSFVLFPAEELPQRLLALSKVSA